MKNALIREDYDRVRALIPPKLRNSTEWQIFDNTQVRYRMFDGRIVSATNLERKEFYSKTFAFFICKPEGAASVAGTESCGGRLLVCFITTQDPYEKETGYNPALAVATGLLRSDRAMKKMVAN